MSSFWRSSVPQKPIRKAFEKHIEFYRFLGSPRGCMPLPLAGLPRQQKTHIFTPSSVFAAEGCKFSISGFPLPLREITFSDFSLPKGVPVKCSGRTTQQQGNHTPLTCPAARWRICTYLKANSSKLAVLSCGHSGTAHECVVNFQ